MAAQLLLQVSSSAVVEPNRKGLGIVSFCNDCGRPMAATGASE